MGFYGKVTNSSKTQFSFDRIYANRKEMDELCASDGVFVGRYVLIDYDEGNASFKRIYVKELGNGKKIAWATPNFDEAIGELKQGNFRKNEIVYEAQPLGDNTTQIIKKYYTVKFVGDSYELVDTAEPAESMESNYVTNFNIDKDYISEKADGDIRAFGRGYDSTVWTKVFEKGQYKYVSVAELNSVVPTFDIAADAPTLSPITPHFDANSTNVYYKLHAQPTWGFRIKKATQELIYDVDPITGEIGGEVRKPEDSEVEEKIVKNIKDENGNIISSFYGLSSDENTVWTRREYNKSTKEIVDYYYNPHTDSWEKYTDPDEPKRNGQLSADIYYNKDGFKKDYIYKSNLEDKIIIEPTGASGHVYAHDQNNNEEKDPNKKSEKTKDIQELSIHLASIGNAISDMWDMVYGDANANRHHEDTEKNEKPAVKWVHKLVNLTKTELEHYQSYLREEQGDKKTRLKWIEKDVKPKDINDSNLHDIYSTTQWSPNKDFYIFTEVPVRNTDIKWRDGLDTISSEPDYESYMGYEEYPPTQSMRLVHSDNKKTIGKEYTYNKDQVSTIAGTINAAHDLMGMIIHEVTDKETITDEYVDNSEENLIYYYPKYKGNTKVPNDDIHLGENRGIILKQEKFEDANINSADDFVLGEMYLYDNDKNKYYLATKYQDGETYYKLNAVDLPDKFQTLRKDDYVVKPGQFYRKKVDYVYEEVPQAQYWNKDNVDNVLWERVGNDGTLIKFDKNRLFTREKENYLDIKGKPASVYRYIPTTDDEALLDKSYYELITKDVDGKEFKVLEQNSWQARTPEGYGNLYFYTPYNLQNDEGYWTVGKHKDENDKYIENVNEEEKKVYTQEIALTITEAEKDNEKNFYQFTPTVLANKELYIPGAYVLKLCRKSIDPTKNDDWILTVSTAPFTLSEEEGGGQKCVTLNQLAKLKYTIGDDNDILEILFKKDSTYYTDKAGYANFYENLGLFPVNLSNPSKNEIDLGNGVYQTITTYKINDRFEAKWAKDFYDPTDNNNDNKYYLAGFDECRYRDFTKNKDYEKYKNNTSKLNEFLQILEEIQTIDKDGVTSTIRKTIPESLIDTYIKKDIKDKEDAQRLLNALSTEKYFFNDPGEYIFKLEEVPHEEDEKFNALNLKKISGLQKVINDGEENSSIQYEDIPAEDFKAFLGLTLEQLLDGIEPDKALYSELGQKMSAINKNINAIVDLYDNGKNSDEINNYEFNFDEFSYRYELQGFDKQIVGKKYYAERLKYINLPECESTTNFYNLMAKKGNLFVLNVPKDIEDKLKNDEEKPENLIEPIESSKYAANAFFVCRIKIFEDKEEPEIYWNLASEAAPKENEKYYDLSNYLIPVKVSEKIDNKKDYYIKSRMPATEEFAWDNVQYYKINKIIGDYLVSPGEEIAENKKDNTILKQLDEESDILYPNPKYFDQVFVIANVGTDKQMYKPDTYYRRITAEEHNGEYELDKTEHGTALKYDGSDYYIWEKDGSNDQDYLRTSDKFFIPNVYYYRDDDKLFWLASWDIFNEHPNAIYYKGKTYYVIKDDLGRYAPGAEWNPAVVPVPGSVHLGVRKEKYKWEKLEDFSRTYNTLNGLILRTNKLLEDGDSYTRDTSTIQGCINRIRDIIAKFEATAPGNLMVVDGYGRIRGAEYITKQPDKFTNYGKKLNDKLGTNIPIKPEKEEYLNHTDENGEFHGRWIDLQVFNYSFNGKDYVDLETVKNITGKLKFIGDPTNNDNLLKGEQYRYYYHWDNLDENTFNQLKDSFYIYIDATENDDATIAPIGDAAYDASKKDKYYQLIDFENQLEGRIKYEHNKRTLEITGHDADELEHYVLKFKPKIKLVHNFINSEVQPDNTTTESNLNLDIPTKDEAAVNKKSKDSSDGKEPGNDIILYSPIVDDMGHIVAHNQENVTLPYGFKYLEAKNNVTENGLDSDIYSNSVTNTENQNVIDTKDKDSDTWTYTRAKKTQDTLLFEAKNKWLQVQLTPKDLNIQDQESIGGSDIDTLTIAHEVHSINRTAKSTDNNVADGITPNDTITVQDLEFDNAGHVTENHKHTYTLPYSYKHITTSHNESVNSITQNTNTTTADNTQDKVEFAMGNKWLESKVENDKVTFAHETHWTAANDATDKDNLTGFNRNVKTSRTSTDLNGQETFTTEHYTFDNAGHVNSHNTHTYEMPYGYSYLLTKGTSTSTDFVTGNDSALGAMKTKDNVEFVAGNRWLTISGSDSNADGVNDTITFRHAPAGEAITLIGDSENQTPDYGATFKVPYVTIDEAGHVKTLTDHTVAMPKQVIKGTGTVVTKVDHDTSNTLTFTHEQLMNLKLSTSSTVETLAVTKSASPDQHTSHTAITSANTLREAFSAIPTMIDERVEDILGTATTDTLDTLTEISAWINANGADLNKYVNLVTLEKDFYGLGSNGKVLSYNSTDSLMNRTSTLETAKNNIYTMLGDVDHYALNGHYSLDHSAERDPNKVYYTFSNGQYVEILLTDSMYEPSKYYIKDVTVEERIKGLESQVDHYVTDDLKQKVDAAWDLLQTVQQTTGNVPANPDTMTPTASVDGYMKYHVGRTAPTDTKGNPITNAMWIDTSNMQNILVKFPVYNYNAETGKNVLSWIAINTWQ